MKPLQPPYNFVNLLMVVFFGIVSSFAQEELPVVNISQGTAKWKLTPKRGDDFLSNYKVFASNPETNSAWFLYIAPFDGEFNMSVDPGNENSISFALFNVAGGEYSKDIYNGKAEIIRVMAHPKPGITGLSKGDEIDSGNRLYPVQLKQGQEVLIYLNTQNLSLRSVMINIWQLSDAREKEGIVLDKKVIDLRRDDFMNQLHLAVKDAETGLPLIASVNISGMKGISNYYVASDLFFDIDRSRTISVKCDKEGYFFFYKDFEVLDDVDNEIVVLLEPLSTGKKLGLPEIQFEMGTSNPTPNAYQIMNRLAEFLLSNPEIRIEIGGHVNETGDNSFAARKISEARAKRVYNFLIEKGVEKQRLEYKGYGNTEMIYPMPKNHHEEQANRRVEITIL